MSEAVMIALIAASIPAVGGIITQLLINASNRRKVKIEDAEKEKLRASEEARKEERLAARLNSIEKNLEENNSKLDIHNGYAEKIGEIQRDISYIKGKMEGEYHG